MVMVIVKVNRKTVRKLRPVAILNAEVASKPRKAMAIKRSVILRHGLHMDDLIKIETAIEESRLAQMPIIDEVLRDAKATILVGVFRKLAQQMNTELLQTIMVRK